MPVYSAVFPGRTNHHLQLHISLRSQSIEGNYSIFDWGLYVVKVSGVGSWKTSATGSANINIEGHTWSRGGWAYDFRNSSSLLLGSGAFVVYHAADGKLTLSSSAYADSSSTLGATSIPNQEWVIPTIPRASKPTYSPEPVDAGVSTTITTNRASTGFTHTIDYIFGSASGNIGTGIGASTTWTPPLSLLNEIPNATTGDVAIITKTYSGATLIGSSTTYLTIKAPTSVVPTFDTVTHSEATAGVAANVGAYVQGVSKLNLAITDAAGVYGSTIVSHKIEVTGQPAINAASGTSGILTTSGTIALKGTITDSRGRVTTETVNVTVLAYAPPVINSASFQRALVSGTPNEEGTYIRVNLNAAVQSLLVGGVQKNDLVYKIYTRARNAPTWTLKKTVPVGAVTFNSYDLVSSYAIEDSWEVLVEVIDDFATSAVAGTVATARIFMHWGGVGEGLAIGKFWEQGGLDILGQAYQNNGLAILDEDDRVEIDLELDNLDLDITNLQALENWRGSNRPVFEVKHTGTFSRSGTEGWSYMQFNTVLANQGDHWKPASYHFVAPVDGLYEFTMGIVATTIVGGPEAGIYKNGVIHSPLVIAYYYYLTTMGRIFMPLVAGDIIAPVFRNNNGSAVTIDGTRSHFAGMLLNTL